MEIAFLHIAEKSAPLVPADIELDADLQQLFFQCLGDAPAQVYVGGFVR